MIHRLPYHRPLALIVLPLALGGAAWAQSGTGTSSSGGSATGSTATSGTSSTATGTARAAAKGPDALFVTKAAQHGLAEVELGKLAQQQGASEEVRQFGARMVQDHSAANQELAQIASSKGLPVPTTLDTRHLRNMDKLRRLTGAAFDREFMNNMVKDHHMDTALFQKQAQNGQDPDLKAFAAKTLPILQDHARSAHSTQEAMRKTPPGGANPGE
jgi:putative membrane protein